MAAHSVHRHDSSARDGARLLIRAMADPAILFSLGMLRDVPYENLVQTFTAWPPALTSQAQWPCTPDACRLLGEQWRLAREPRLRDVGLTILMTMDPARWSDTVLARSATGSPAIASAALLANGVGAQWPVAAKLPIPAAGAGWREWLAWSSANDPRYPPPTGRPTQTAMRFEESHATAIRFYQLRTGRDVVAELRAAHAAATDDSARMVFGTILIGLGDRSSVDEVAAQFRSGSAPQIALAERGLRGLFGARAPLADSATTIAVLDRLIASVVDGAAPWPSLTPLRDSMLPPPRIPVGSAGRPNTFVLADSIPPLLRDRWRGRVRFIGMAEWQRMPEREAASLLTLSSVQRVGAFLRVRTHHSGRLGRQPNETPLLSFAGESYYLLARDGGWVVVSMDMWMT